MTTVFEYLQIVVLVLLLPLLLVVFFLFLALWLVLTITGIGPVLQYYCNIEDDQILDRNVMILADSDLKLINIPPGIHSCAPQGYTMFAIYSEGKGSKASSSSSSALSSTFPSVCIPNGLGATAIFISRIQEQLVNAGFTVLSFDRLGVGLSDKNMSGKSPTAMDMVNEMHYVMSHFQRLQEQSPTMPPPEWILIGPSMGSIVSQCYLSQLHTLNNNNNSHCSSQITTTTTTTTTDHNDRISIKVTGFLNMDGLPYPFIHFNSLFQQAGSIYHIYAAVIWTGILRPFIHLACNDDMKKAFGCKKFTMNQMKAQINQTQFFGNIGYEMHSMMACCEMADQGWGHHSILKIREKDESLYQTLVRAPPSHSYLIDPVTSVRSETSERSVSELGSDWCSEEQVRRAVKLLLDPAYSNNKNNNSTIINVMDATDEKSTSIANYGTVTSTTTPVTKNPPILTEVFQQLVVRVMSARCHDFGNAVMNSFYKQEMRHMAAAEHSQHWLFARQLPPLLPSASSTSAVNGEDNSKSSVVNSTTGGNQRSVYPRITHMAMFAQVQEIVDNTLTIAHTLLQHSSSPSSSSLNV